MRRGGPPHGRAKRCRGMRRQRHGENRPCGRPHRRQASGPGFRYEREAEAERGPRRPGAQSPSRPVDDRDWHHREDGLPTSPAIERNQTVRTHDPYKAGSGIAPLQKSERRRSIGRRQILLESGDGDPAVYGDLARLFDSVRLRPELCMRFERIARTDEPPDRIQLEPSQCKTAEAQMSDMRGIEAAAQQTDPLARRRKRQPHLYRSEVQSSADMRRDASRHHRHLRRRPVTYFGLT